VRELLSRSTYFGPIYIQLPLVKLDSWRDLLMPGILEKKCFEVQRFEWDDAILSKTYSLNKASKDLKIA
jgi:hypothetical protein